jgi:acetyl esterase/lipase
MTMTSASGDFKIHPDMNELIAAKKALTDASDSSTVRSEWENYGSRLSRPYPPGMKVESLSFECGRAGRNGKIDVRVYRPAEAEATHAPCVLFLHGGGFLKGSLDSADSNAWGVAYETGAVVVSVDYRLAPEFPYPDALTDVYAVLEYVVSNCESLGIDRDRVAVWGESAGGNLAAAVALMARDRKGPNLSAQVIVYGCLTDDLTSNSYVVHGQSIGLQTSFMVDCWTAYLGGRDPKDEVYSTPLKHPDLRGVPPAFIHYAEIDPLADDSPQYARRLKDAGVPTVLRCADGMIHGFIRARFGGPAAEREFTLPCMFLRGIFAAR